MSPRSTKDCRETITHNRVAANFVGWEKDHALFDRELEKVIRALRTDEAGREKPPTSRLLGRVITVSLETMKVVKGLSPMGADGK